MHRDGRLNGINPYSAGIDFSRQNLTSVDVSCRRQILTTKVDPRAARAKIFIMAVDPYHRYSNESGSANEDIYDDFKLKKPHLVAMFFTNLFSALRVKTGQSVATEICRQNGTQLHK